MLRHILQTAPTCYADAAAVQSNVTSLSAPTSHADAAATETAQHSNHNKSQHPGKERSSLASEVPVSPVPPVAALALAPYLGKIPSKPKVAWGESQLVVRALKVWVKPSAVLVISAEHSLPLPPTIPVIEAPIWPKSSDTPRSKFCCSFCHLIRRPDPHSNYSSFFQL